MLRQWTALEPQKDPLKVAKPLLSIAFTSQFFHGYSDLMY